MALYDVPAPAKLNLFLHVVGRRSDGYHLLQTAFRFVDLQDFLDFDVRADGQIALERSLEGVSPQDDLVVRAARALQQATGCSRGAQIIYRKSIPTGAGLGGGSSDAASTLVALNRLWKTGLSRRELMTLALPLGADVPVFIFGQAALAEGVGEVLSPLTVPDRSYVVVQPPQHVATQMAFSDPNLTRDTKPFKITVFTDWQQVQATQKVGNDLQAVIYARYPKVAQAHNWLSQQGMAVQMTGSGSCLFAEFVTHEQAQVMHQKIAVKIAHCPNGKAVIKDSWVCRGLHDHPLRHWTTE